MKISIYCDGSSSGNSSGPGGYAYVILADGVAIEERGGHLPVATNNIAEIVAANEGMARLLVLIQSGSLQPENVELVSDSQLVLRYASGEYRCKAQHLLPYYIRLRKLYGETKATTRWVRGHTGDTWNERCDKLAKAGRNGEEHNASYSLPVQAEPEST